MNLQRHWAAEDELHKRGLKPLEMYWMKVRHPVIGVVQFTVNYDPVYDYWTASFKLPPYKAQATIITVDAEPFIHKDGTVHFYRSRLLAEQACKKIMKTLKVSIQ
jgi:hypothetical protein